MIYNHILLGGINDWTLIRERDHRFAHNLSSGHDLEMCQFKSNI